jgi:hypothetical protein
MRPQDPRAFRNAKVKLIILDSAARIFGPIKMACNAQVNKKFQTSLKSKLQALFSAMMLLVISLTTIPLVTIQSEAQPLLSQQERLLNNIAFFFLDAFEYTMDIQGAQIFPNDTVKHSIVTEYNPSVYNIPSLQYKIMEHTINASDVEIHVNPTRMDQANTKLVFQIYANNAEVTGQWLSKGYNNFELRSAYGIYNRITDKMTIHIPYSEAMQHLLQ